MEFEGQYLTYDEYVEIGGSANMMDYIFKKGEVEYLFGDSYYEDGKVLLIIKMGAEEAKHEISPCYWLDMK